MDQRPRSMVPGRAQQFVGGVDRKCTCYKCEGGEPWRLGRGTKPQSTALLATCRKKEGAIYLQQSPNTLFLTDKPQQPPFLSPWSFTGSAHYMCFEPDDSGRKRKYFHNLNIQAIQDTRNPVVGVGCNPAMTFLLYDYKDLGVQIRSFNCDPLLNTVSPSTGLRDAVSLFVFLKSRSDLLSLCSF